MVTKMLAAQVQPGSAATEKLPTSAVAAATTDGETISEVLPVILWNDEGMSVQVAQHLLRLLRQPCLQQLPLLQL